MACPDKIKDDLIIAEHKRRKEEKPVYDYSYVTVIVEGSLLDYLMSADESQIDSITKEENYWRIVLLQFPSIQL